MLDASLPVLQRLASTILLCSLAPMARAYDAEKTLVVLLHGLARTSGSMERMEAALKAEGFDTCNVGYPSTDLPVEALASQEVLPAVMACLGGRRWSVSFVTHSMGGIIVRQLAATTDRFAFGRVVMLGPPNGGSEVVDKLGGFPPFRWIHGPAGTQLGTDPASLPKSLGPTELDLGVIAGRRTINPVNSLMIPGPDDGKVSVENAKLEGMRDFIVLPVSHPFLMKDDEAIWQTIRFLKFGAFDHATGPGRRD